MNDFYVFIPARYDSKRLPGKVLMDLHGKPMLQHVFERAKFSGAKDVIIATDDLRIKKVAEGFSAKVCITKRTHQSGTTRIAEAQQKIGFRDDDIIVNVQGDEPLIPAEIIKQVANNLAKHEIASTATLCMPITSRDELFDPNVVKVVKDKNNFALYFSRAPIAWERDNFSNMNTNNAELKCSHFRHVGIYAYRVKFLQEYCRLKPCFLEDAEKLEQLRILWHGKKIHIDLAKKTVPAGVDTKLDIARVRKAMQ
jgi:3-deoxy-manno-octulosonate cytidylyltransferase (CMP-KDO synthetase)